jgi:glycosyltransferase involved in cell wall biosynthesis
MRIGVDASTISLDVTSSHARVTALLLRSLERFASGGLVALHPTGAHQVTAVEAAIQTLAANHVRMHGWSESEWVQRRLLKQAIDERIDVLICEYHEVPLFSPRRIAVVPIIHDLCGLSADSGYRLLGRARWRHYWRLWTAARRADGLLYVSHATRNAFVKAFPECRQRPCAEIPWFLDGNTTHSEPVRSSVESPRDLPYFLAFGYPGRRKGTDLLAHAFGTYRTLGGKNRLVVMLSGLSVSAAEAMFADTRQHVSFIANVNDTERDLLLEGARALLFPSRCEGFGLPLLEALERGTWSLAFEETPATEILVDASLLARWADPADFADRMIAFDVSWSSASDDTSRRKASARAQAANFSRRRFEHGLHGLLTTLRG